MFQTQESIADMLRHVITRCAVICRSLNSETYGEERGPDCARRIEKEAESLVQESLALNKQPALIETCDQGHKFIKLPDHPKHDGMARCPYCMATGLDAAREEIKQLEQRSPKMTYAEVVAWLASEEGKQSIAQALASANVTIETLRTERQVDPSLLHQPFGMEHNCRG